MLIILIKEYIICRTTKLSDTRRTLELYFLSDYELPDCTTVGVVDRENIFGLMSMIFQTIAMSD